MKSWNFVKKDQAKGYGMCQQTHRHTDNAHRTITDERGSLRLTTTRVSLRGGISPHPPSPLKVSMLPLVNFVGIKTSHKRPKVPPHNAQEPKFSWGSMPPCPQTIYTSYKYYPTVNIHVLPHPPYFDIF